MRWGGYGGWGLVVFCCLGILVGMRWGWRSGVGFGVWGALVLWGVLSGGFDSGVLRWSRVRDCGGVNRVEGQHC